MGSILDDKNVLFKLKAVLSVIDGDKTLSQVSKDIGRTRKTLKTWVDDYKSEGVGGLRNKPRGKSKSLDGDVRELIVELKRENRSRSSRKIRDLLKGYGIKVHRQTVWRVLKAAGENRREKKQLKPDKDYEYPEPNDAWHIDIMEGIIVKGVGMVYLHLIKDDHSREIMKGRFYTSREARHIFKVMKEAFSRNGLPRHMCPPDLSVSMLISGSLMARCGSSRRECFSELMTQASITERRCFAECKGGLSEKMET